MEMIFSHGDTDGICSAALAYSKYPEAELWISTPIGLLKDVKACNADLTVICDLAISERDKDALFREFKRISSKGELNYIDHHPLPLYTLTGDLPCTKIMWDTKKSSSELTYRFLNLDDMSHLALFGAIADYCDSTRFVVEELDFYDKRTISLEAGLLSQCLGVSRGDYSFKREIIKELANGKMPSSMQRVVRKALKASKKEWQLYDYVRENVHELEGLAVIRTPNGLSPTKAAKFAIGAAGSPVGLSTQDRDSYVDISVRKRYDLSLDLNHVLRTIAPRLGGSGGGHESAAGARIPKEKFEEFVMLLSTEVFAAL
ncbi:MAG: DHHA1 domain-containing protein [Candidatus Hydrothermarchaeales archaeon]